MWYDDVTEEDIVVLNKMLLLNDVIKWRYTYFGRKDFIKSMDKVRKIPPALVCHKSLIVLYEDLPLVINISSTDRIYATWRLKIGK